MSPYLIALFVMNFFGSNENVESKYSNQGDYTVQVFTIKFKL